MLWQNQTRELDKTASAATDKKPVAKKSKMIVEQSIKGVYLVDTQKNNTNWELWAENALSNTETSDWRFNDLAVKFYTKERQVYNVKASAALVNIKKKQMYFDNGVVVTSPNGYMMKTKSIRYNFDEKTIQSDETVEITADKNKVKEPIYFKSSNLKVDLNSSIIDIEEVISSRTTQDKRKIDISSREARLYGNNYKVRYQKNVRLKGLNMNLTSYALDLKIARRQKALKTVVALGNVKVISDNRQIEAGKAHLDVGTEILTLTQSPKLTQNQDVLLGEKIVFYVKTKSVSVKSPRAKVDKLELESYEKKPIKSQ